MASSSKPLLPEIGVLALVPDQWGDMWQPRQQVLTRLARYFHVVWINPAHEWRDSLKDRKERATSNNNNSIRPPGFIVYTPEFWLPELYRPKWLAEFSFCQRLKNARNLLVSQGCQKIILYLWRPEFERALGAVPFHLSCYHIDDEYSFSDVELPTDEIEMRLITAVDQVFIHSPGLLQKKGALNPHTTFVPNGVDYQAYAKPTLEPVDLASIPRPRIGYTGWLKKQLDWPLLQLLTQRHLDWSFVFVGAHSDSSPETNLIIQELSERSNVYFLGAKSTQELAAYPQHFGVCLMPYQANNYTQYIYPLKLHEYLASGSPVVGTQICSLEEFFEVVTLANTPDEWSNAIVTALRPSPDAAEHRERRQAVAQQHDWNVLVKRIAKTMLQRLDQESTERLERAIEEEDGRLSGLEDL